MFPGAVLACAVVLVLTVRRQHSPRSAKTLGERCPARGEACGGRRESPGPASRADDALGPPPLTSQIPCSSATGIHLSSASLRDSVGFVKQAHASQPPTLPQVTDENAILRASEKDGEQGQKEITHDRGENPHCPESPETLNQEISRRRQRGQEREGEERLERAKARGEQGPKDQAGPSRPGAEHLLRAIPSPDLPGEDGAAGSGDVEHRGSAGNDHRPLQRAAGDLKDVAGDAGVAVSPRGPEGGHRDTARQRREDQHLTAEPTGQANSLRTQEAALQRENSQLESEIQQLKLQLQSLQDARDEHILQRHKKWFREEARCLEIKRKLANLYRDMNCTDQLHNLYKKMAQDVGQELERNSPYCHQEVLAHWDRAQKSWVAAVSTKRNLEALRAENDHIRPLLAHRESSCQPFPRGPFAPAAPPAAQRGREGSGGSPGSPGSPL